MGHDKSRHAMHHRRWMSHNIRRRGRRFGLPGGPRGRTLFRDFLTDNPDCAEQLARYSVARMRDEGITDEEIRGHLAHAPHHGFGLELDIDDLLA